MDWKRLGVDLSNANDILRLYDCEIHLPRPLDCNNYLHVGIIICTQFPKEHKFDDYTPTAEISISFRRHRLESKALCSAFDPFGPAIIIPIFASWKSSAPQ